MIIDEKKEYCLSNFAQIKKKKQVIESDHNGLLLELNIEFFKRKPERHEMFNLKNKECQETFKNETEQNTGFGSAPIFIWKGGYVSWGSRQFWN